MIACGFDVHRAQITFDLVDRQTGELRRGRIAPATRAALRVWLGGVDCARLVVALEGTTGWRFVAEELAAAGAQAVLAEPGETRALRGPKRRAKTDRADARWLWELLERGEIPESWIPPTFLLELRCLVQLRQTLAAERRAWLQRIPAQLFHHGLPVGGELAAKDGRDWLAGAELSPAGRQLVSSALATIDFLDHQLSGIDAQLRRFARAHPATRALIRLYGVGELTAVAIYAAVGDARRFSSARKVVVWPDWTSRCTNPTPAASPAGSVDKARRCCAGPRTRRAWPPVGRAHPITLTTSRYARVSVTRSPA